MADDLEAGLVKKWLDENVQPNDVWKKLQLDHNVHVALKSEYLGTFSKYVSGFNLKNSNSQTSLLERFVARYGEVEVAKARNSEEAHENLEMFSHYRRFVMPGYDEPEIGHAGKLHQTVQRKET
ncbi:hypothetical protein GQ600_17057 [Phytophthora cactorum]|nr:hypothetical protein GQ600_17057 [Phytophthora cactorum]